MTMYETKTPERIERSQIIEALAVLGIDAKNAARVCIDTTTVTIEAFLRDENGSLSVAPRGEDGEFAGYLKAVEKVAIIVRPARDRSYYLKGGAL